jgi:hypothetical protein
MAGAVEVDAEVEAEIEIAVRLAQLAVNEGRMVARVMVETNFPMPVQDEHLLYQFELRAQEVGRAFMRAYYQALVEKADAELVLSYRGGKDGQGIQRIGRKRYTIRTTFGTVKVLRIRVKHRDGSTEIPSARSWQTPKQIYLSRSLKQSICDSVRKLSYGDTVVQLARESGEAKLISKSTVKNILHRESEQLAAAHSARAEEVFQADKSIKKLIGEPGAQIAEDHFETVFLAGADLTDSSDEEIAAFFQQIDWRSGEFKEDQLVTANDAADDSSATTPTALASLPLASLPKGRQIIVEP